ncbi:hypothetical protein Adt_30198 [Abeliophyllum distichum]|uniref:Uncharacterized protein n=1 Tax=Abeliophyllum distichum TaxID=126358 RepID=A0ABD1RAK0_9LAMI
MKRLLEGMRYFFPRVELRCGTMDLRLTVAKSRPSSSISYLCTLKYAEQTPCIILKAVFEFVKYTTRYTMAMLPEQTKMKCNNVQAIGFIRVICVEIKETS